jgi:hypothetical protein
MMQMMAAPRMEGMQTEHHLESLPTRRKRKAELDDSQRLHKRLSLLNIGMLTRSAHILFAASAKNNRCHRT